MLALVIFAGLVRLVPHAIGIALSVETSADETSLRASLIAIAALTASIGAVIALPFTMIRLSLSHEQTATTQESLFNDKINAAINDLHATRQITRFNETYQTKIWDEWEDDVVRRNGAIDRLFGLVQENPKSASRVARLLSVYVRELSKRYPADKMPEEIEGSRIQMWTRRLFVKRSDMEHAVQVLGRLHGVIGVALDSNDIDLRRSNLQAMGFRGGDYTGGIFEESMFQGAKVSRCDFTRSNLVHACFDGCLIAETNFSEANCRDLCLRDGSLNRCVFQRTFLAYCNLSFSTTSETFEGYQAFAPWKVNGTEFRYLILPDQLFSSLSNKNGCAFQDCDFTKVSNFDHKILSFGDASNMLPMGITPESTDWP